MARLVLLLGNDSLTQLVVGSGLQTYGYEVATASTPAVAEEILQSRRVGVLVTDLGGRLLAPQGGIATSDVSVSEEPLVWRAPSTEAVVDMIYKSTVPAAMLLERQAPEARELIHRAILEGAAQFARDGEYMLACPAVMAAARKP